MLRSPISAPLLVRAASRVFPCPVLFPTASELFGFPGLTSNLTCCIAFVWKLLDGWWDLVLSWPLLCSSCPVMVGLCPNSEGTALSVLWSPSPHLPSCSSLMIAPLWQAVGTVGERKVLRGMAGRRRGERSGEGHMPQPPLIIPVFLTADLSCARRDHNKCVDKMLSSKHACLVNFVSPALQEEQRWFALFLEVDTFSSHSPCSCWELPTLEGLLHGVSASVRDEGRFEGSIFFIPWGNIQILDTTSSWADKLPPFLSLPQLWDGLVASSHFSSFFFFFSVRILASPCKARHHSHSCTLESGHQWDFTSPRPSSG